MKLARHIAHELVRQLRARNFYNVASEKDFIQGEQRVVFDVFAERKHSTVVEIEERRTAPVHNAAKVIRWVSHSRRKRKVTLVQVFFKEFYTKPMNKVERDLACFIGFLGCEILKGRFNYVPIDVLVKPRRSGRSDDIVREVAVAIADQMLSYEM